MIADVTILLATHNGERFLNDFLESLIGQSYKKWELLISDDHSSDRTLDIIEEYKKRDKRILIISKNKKYGSAKKNFSNLLEYVYRNSKSSYFMFADQDDVWLENKIEMALSRMSEIDTDNHPCLLYTDLMVVDSDLNIICESLWAFQNINPNRNSFKDLLIQNVVTGSTVMFNRKLLDISPHIPENAIMHDWWYALVASAFGMLDYINSATVLYRQHGKNETGAMNWRWPRDLPSLANRFLKPSKYITSVRKLFSQAVDFYQFYGNRLDKNNIQIIEKFISIKNQYRFMRPFQLYINSFKKSDTLRTIGFYLYSILV